MGTSAIASYTKYLTALRAKDPKVLLGSLVWYSVSENVRVKHADLIALLTNLGIDAGAPPEPRDEDVFRRVATAQARKKVETDDPDVYENYMIRDVKRGPDEFVKQIVVEQVNAKGVKLGYEPTVQLKFTVATGKIEVTEIGQQPNPQAMNVATIIKRDFRTDRGHVNAYGIRELIRRVANGVGATCVKPTGGVYFIMESQRATVDALVALAKAIPGVSFHPVPLINDAEQQAMLKEAFEAETKGAVEDRLNEIDALLAGPEITPRRYEALVEEMHSLIGKTEPYRDLLDDTLANTDLVLQSLEAKMATLFTHVKAD